MTERERYENTNDRQTERERYMNDTERERDYTKIRMTDREREIRK